MAEAETNETEGEGKGGAQPQDAEEMEAEFEDSEFEEDDGPYTSADFHAVTQKLVLNAVYETLADSKFDWEVVRPFLGMARDMARADFEEARFRLHTVRAAGDEWVEAEEAYLGLSVADRDDGEEWLAETRWLSELATAEDDPEEVRLIIAALERTIAKLRLWLHEKEAGGDASTPPPA